MRWRRGVGPFRDRATLAFRRCYDSTLRDAYALAEATVSEAPGT